MIADDRLGIGLTKRDNKADITISVAPEHQKIQVPKRVAIEINHLGIKCRFVTHKMSVATLEIVID